MIEDTAQLKAEYQRLHAMLGPQSWDRDSWTRGAMAALAWVIAQQGHEAPPSELLKAMLWPPKREGA